MNTSNKIIDFDRYSNKDNFLIPNIDNYDLFTRNNDNSIIIGTPNVFDMLCKDANEKILFVYNLIKMIRFIKK